MRFFPILTSILCLCLVCDEARAQQILFEDDFSIDPAANGWTSLINTSNTATGAFFTAGGSAEIDKTGGTGFVEGSITRFFDTRGFSDITLELLAFQSNTQFEGGAYRAFNTDSLSIFVDTGGGFVPFLQRTGVWGATGPGFTDGGTGAGAVASASSGTLAAGVAASDNAAFGVRIEGLVWAAAESYFLDLFRLQGQALPLSAPVVVTDLEAVDSFFFSGMPTVAALADSNLGAIQFSRRDINERLFRLQTQSPDAQPKQAIQARGAESAELPDEVASTLESDWQYFAKSDFGGRWNDDPTRGLADSTDFRSGTMGFEYSGGNTWAGGMAWTYLESNSEMNPGQTSSLDLTGQQFHGYLSWLPSSQSFLSLLYTYSDFDNELERKTGLGDTARAATGSHASTISLDAGYRLESGDFTMGPVAGFDFTSAAIDGFSESGSMRGGLDVESQSFHSLVSNVGWQISRTIPKGRALIIPQVRVAWEREHESAREVSAALQQSPFLLAQGGGIVGSTGGLQSTVSQAQSGRDYLSGGAGIRVIIDDTWSVALDYEGHFFRADSSAHFGGVRVSAKF